MTDLTNKSLNESYGSIKVKKKIPRKISKGDNTVYRVTEVFSKDKNMGDIMKRLVLKKARNFQK